MHTRRTLLGGMAAAGALVLTGGTALSAPAILPSRRTLLAPLILADLERCCQETKCSPDATRITLDLLRGVIETRPDAFDFDRWLTTRDAPFRGGTALVRNRRLSVRIEGQYPKGVPCRGPFEWRAVEQQDVNDLADELRHDEEVLTRHESADPVMFRRHLIHNPRVALDPTSFDPVMVFMTTDFVVRREHASILEPHCWGAQAPT